MEGRDINATEPLHTWSLGQGCGSGWRFTKNYRYGKQPSVFLSQYLMLKLGELSINILDQCIYFLFNFGLYTSIKTKYLMDMFNIFPKLGI